MGDRIIDSLGTILAAFVGVLTWFLASGSERRRDREERENQRRVEKAQREQRVLDIVVALHSEILAGVGANRVQLTRKEAEYAMSNRTPFATADETDFVFDSVKSDLSILPAEVIHSVVQYYRIAMQSNLLTKDLRDPYFREQTRDEKRRFVGLLLQTVERQKLWGVAALADLAEYGKAHGLDLNRNEQRADGLLQQARAELKLIFKKSERSDPSLKASPSRRRKPS